MRCKASNVSSGPSVCCTCWHNSSCALHESTTGDMVSAAVQPGAARCRRQTAHSVVHGGQNTSSCLPCTSCCAACCPSWDPSSSLSCTTAFASFSSFFLAAATGSLENQPDIILSLSLCTETELEQHTPTVHTVPEAATNAQHQSARHPV